MLPQTLIKRKQHQTRKAPNKNKMNCSRNTSSNMAQATDFLLALPAAMPTPPTSTTFTRLDGNIPPSMSSRTSKQEIILNIIDSALDLLDDDDDFLELSTNAPAEGH
jgi:hypothetical protein